MKLENKQLKEDNESLKNNIKIEETILNLEKSIKDILTNYETSFKELGKVEETKTNILNQEILQNELRKVREGLNYDLNIVYFLKPRLTN